MALHGTIQVNGATIGAWYARRTEGLLDSAQVSNYECGVDYLVPGEPIDGEPLSMRFNVRHKYDEGAVALAAKVLTRAVS